MRILVLKHQGIEKEEIIDINEKIVDSIWKILNIPECHELLENFIDKKLKPKSHPIS